jgi:hypothetical protein
LWNAVAPELEKLASDLKNYSYTDLGEELDRHKNIVTIASKNNTGKMLERGLANLKAQAEDPQEQEAVIRAYQYAGGRPLAYQIQGRPLKTGCTSSKSLVYSELPDGAWFLNPSDMQPGGGFGKKKGPELWDRGEAMLLHAEIRSRALSVVEGGTEDAPGPQAHLPGRRFGADRRHERDGAVRHPSKECFHGIRVPYEHG